MQKLELTPMISPGFQRECARKDQRLRTLPDQDSMKLRKPEVVADLESNRSDTGAHV